MSHAHVCTADPLKSGRAAAMRARSLCPSAAGGGEGAAIGGVIAASKVIERFTTSLAIVQHASKLRSGRATTTRSTSSRASACRSAPDSSHGLQRVKRSGSPRRSCLPPGQLRERLGDRLQECDVEVRRVLVIDVDEVVVLGAAQVGHPFRQIGHGRVRALQRRRGCQRQRGLRLGLDLRGFLPAIRGLAKVRPTECCHATAFAFLA